MRYLKRLFLPVCVLSLVLLVGNSAWADQISFTLNNTGVAGGPFVNVTVNLTGGVATITFTSTGGAAIIDGGSLDLNVNGAFNVTGTSGFSAFNGNWCSGNGQTLVGNACQDIGGRNISGFGNFNLVLNQFAGSGNSSNQVIVTLTGTWGSAADVLLTNSDGSSAASHVSLNGCTFFVGNGPTNSPASCAVPEPSVYIGLLGSGLLALPFIRRIRIH